MRTKYLMILVMALAALFLPRAAHAQCEGPCESWAVFNPDSGTITGGSSYEFNDSDWYVMVESYIWDPYYNYTYLGSAEGWMYAEFDFSGYPAQYIGTYTVAGFNSWQDPSDNSWEPDGNSSGTVQVLELANAPQISSCDAPQPQWVVGLNSFTCHGSNLSGTSVGFLPEGNVSPGGVWTPFLQSDGATVSQDGTEIYVTVTLGPVLYSPAEILIMDGTDYEVDLPDIEPPSVLVSCPLGIAQGKSDTCSIDGLDDGEEATVTLTQNREATFPDGSTSMEVTGTGSTITVTIYGISPSSTANDVTLAVTEDGEIIGSNSFSIVTVSISMNATNGASPAGDDAGARNFLSTVVSGGPLGRQINSDANSITCSIGVELVGAITPSNYAGTVTLQRQILGGMVWAGQGPQSKTVNPGPDTYIDAVHDNNPQSGGSNGKVYDLDAPGINGGNSPVPNRARYNFQEYAVLGGPGAGPQVGAGFSYYVRASCRGTSSNPSFDDTLTSSGDNQAGQGATLLTWNFQ